LIERLKELETFVGKQFDFSGEFYQMHNQFINGVQYLNCQTECDKIIQSIIDEKEIDILPLTLFQESYINAKLENFYKKEMPFHQPEYFTNTKDVLHYIKTQAPNL
jgi:hypothetical protein